MGHGKAASEIMGEIGTERTDDGCFVMRNPPTTSIFAQAQGLLHGSGQGHDGNEIGIGDREHPSRMMIGPGQSSVALRALSAKRGAEH